MRLCGNAVVGEEPTEQRTPYTVSIPCDGFFPRNSDLIEAFIVLPPTQPRMVDTQGGMRKACTETGKRNFLSTNSARRAVTAAIGSTSSSSAAEANPPPVFCSFPKPLTLHERKRGARGNTRETHTARRRPPVTHSSHQDQNAVAFLFFSCFDTCIGLGSS